MLLYFQLRIGVTRIIGGQSPSVGVKNPRLSEKGNATKLSVLCLMRKSEVVRHYYSMQNSTKAVMSSTWVRVTTSGPHNDSLDLGPLLQQLEQGTLHGARQHLTVKVIPANMGYEDNVAKYDKRIIYKYIK